MLLDDWLPNYRLSERHATTVEASPAEALAAFLSMPVAGDPLVRALFRARGLGGDARASVAEFANRRPFVQLACDEVEFVFGSGRGIHGHASTPEQWRGIEEPGLKIAANVRVVPLADGRARLTTETRVLPLGRRTAVAFRLYWIVVRPFSGLIRRRWLRAAARAARANG